MQKTIQIDLKDFSYELPEEKIAFEGTLKRDLSKLLYSNNGKIEDYMFKDITSLIPDKSTLVFNNTKVIPARIHLHKNTGASIEIFLLKPAYKNDIALALETTSDIAWECIIGNLKKWKEGEVLYAHVEFDSNIIELSATLINKEDRIVEFSWQNNLISFAQIIQTLGNTPLPPYIKRAAKETDKERYQTVYSLIEGAVAAPTAGLHFTNEILSKLEDKKVKQEHITLHVGAGTFMPIKSESVQEHSMHNETMQIPVKVIESLVKSENIIAVGTTSMRTLESLYWFGVKLIDNPDASFFIEKLYPYQDHSNLPTKNEALKAVILHAKKANINIVSGSTEIFIFPGYKFKVCDGLITNFHQPGSTLILLVAAFVKQHWRNIYNHALQNNYRFLSFGDSSFLIP